MLHHMALLVALDRKHPLVAGVIGVVGDGTFEGRMQPFQPVFEDVVETDQDWGAEVACFQPLEQLHQIERSTPIAAGLHHHMAFGVD